MSRHCESSPLDFVFFSAFQWAKTARVGPWLCQFLDVPMSRKCESSPFVPMSEDCKSWQLFFAKSSMSQWVGSARVEFLTLLISRCSTERWLQEFAVRLCLFLGVPRSRHCESSPLDFVFFSVSHPNEWRLQEFAFLLGLFLGAPMSGNCESTLLDLTHFSVLDLVFF